MERNANRGPQTRARILVVTVGVLISMGIGLYIHRSLTVSNLPDIIDTVSNACISLIAMADEEAEEWPRIFAVRDRASLWTFKVSTGPLATESIIGYGTFSSRTLNATFTESSEGVIPRIFQPGRSVRLSCPNKVKDSLTRQEGLERAAKLRRFLSNEQVARDIEYWYEAGTPDSISMWHALLERGWLARDDKTFLFIFLYDDNAFDGELDFLAEPSAYEEEMWPYLSQVGIGGSIRTDTLEIETGLWD